jgi:hypothetical protein
MAISMKWNPDLHIPTIFDKIQQYKLYLFNCGMNGITYFAPLLGSALVGFQNLFRKPELTLPDSGMRGGSYR